MNWWFTVAWFLKERTNIKVRPEEILHRRNFIIVCFSYSFWMFSFACVGLYAIWNFKFLYFDYWVSDFGVPYIYCVLCFSFHAFFSSIEHIFLNSFFKDLLDGVFCSLFQASFFFLLSLQHSKYVCLHR